ncbi:hypothetical protein BG53_11385 [Paenibacillus darwinianus]|uniref:RsgI N-terminal anti-sigma domain-containing protein n=1 Tax=Paenibacillus darwinianus TaxID=1380763 RepID=A0A9W5W8M1_9BACL|nr:anti-sigma factor domain-containing protein [Paenibacillus darwinianus]EXX87735.1 hypothetical protein BG52_03535 [Paenibacillus darwinianus]EXX91452.1 hypothetical protein BG53_11385 [Paenibacillus darwinianus]EXX92202.1 hypothetical protein CH50_11775 [Paenibacillus darwinianus]
MNRGVVLEVHKKFCVVLTPDGSYRKVPGFHNRRIGEEIEFGGAASVTIRRPIWLPAAAAAAVILLLALALPRVWPFGGPEVAAYVAMDINPSIEFGIAANRDVLELRALNADGAAVIKGVAFKGKPIEDVASQIIKNVNAARYLELNDGDIFITSILVDGRAAVGFEDEVASAVDQAVTQTVEEAGTGTPVQITHLKAPVELRDTSMAQGVSPGKMAVYLLANKEGAPIKLEALKQTSIHNAVKSLGGVKALMGAAAADEEGIKAELKKLLKTGEAAAKANVKDPKDAEQANDQPKTGTKTDGIKEQQRDGGDKDRAEAQKDKKADKKGKREDAGNEDRPDDDDDNNNDGGDDYDDGDSGRRAGADRESDRKGGKSGGVEEIKDDDDTGDKEDRKAQSSRAERQPNKQTDDKRKNKKEDD